MVGSVMSNESAHRLAGFRRRARSQWPVWLLTVFIVLLSGLLMLAEPLSPMDMELPELDMRKPNGERLVTGDLEGRPWLINIWLPG